jgi:uncharacterized repeat protein (TIGR03803 family)
MNPFIKLVHAAALSIFALAISVHATDNLNIVYSFSSHSGASNPFGNLTMNSSGNFYGEGGGGVFELTPNGSGGYEFTLIAESAAGYGSLALDSAGNLYDATENGNIDEFSSNGAGGWTATTLYSFGDTGVSSPLIVDTAGNLYGASGFGGVNSMGFIFELTPGSGGWILTDLHDFSGSDGAEGFGAGLLVGGLAMDASGNIYGTTIAGGSSTNCGSSGCGVVFKLTKTGSAWNETVLHNFQGTDGANPDVPLLIDSAGNLYGTTVDGGTDGFGVVFETSKASGRWRTGVLHNFASGTDGAYPNSALVMDSSGNLYGSTFSGGGSDECIVESDNGCGMTFALLHQDNKWKESVLVDFTGFDGAFPTGLTIGSPGHLFGGAEGGGRYGGGIIFELLVPSE